MWEYEHAVETSASRDTVWRHWSDVTGWPRWNAGIAAIDADGPFAVGTAVRMTVPGQAEPITLRLVRVVPEVEFADELDAGDFVVRTEHKLEALASDRTRIVYRTRITGPAADQIGPQLGPQITADFPEVLAALVRLAES